MAEQATYYDGEAILPKNAEFLLIADTHASYPEAPHELQLNDYLADSVVGAAMRPPQMDFWGTRVLAWILAARGTQTSAIIHLGDAGNIGCEYEFDRFLAEMKGARAPWFFTPGNHDSLLMGNLAYEAPHLDADTRWGRECGIANPMDKRVLVDKYISAKMATGPQQWVEVEVNGLWDWWHRWLDRVHGYECRQFTAPAPVLHAISCRKIYKNGKTSFPDSHAWVWGDFIVQTIQLPRSTILLIDSTDFRQLPDLWHPGGAWGGVSEQQVRMITRLLTRHPTPETPILIGTHFPLDALDLDSQLAFEKIIASTGALMAFTAHTHSPTAERRHPIIASPKRNFLEVNVGSVIGWPMEFSYVEIPVASQVRMTVASAARLLTTKDAVCEKQLITAWGDGPEVESLFDETRYQYYTHLHRPHGYARLVRQMFADEKSRLTPEITWVEPGTRNERTTYDSESS